MMKLEYDAVCLYDYTPQDFLMHQQYSRLVGKQSASLGHLIKEKKQTSSLRVLLLTIKEHIESNVDIY
jgi:hypothetical protein